MLLNNNFTFRQSPCNGQIYDKVSAKCDRYLNMELLQFKTRYSVQLIYSVRNIILFHHQNTIIFLYSSDIRVDMTEKNCIRSYQGQFDSTLLMVI